MPKNRGLPIRTCLGCGEPDEQRTMIRLHVGPDGRLQVAKGSVGRGGYIHNRDECWQPFVKRKSIYRAFRAEISRSAREELIRDLRSQTHGE